MQKLSDRSSPLTITLLSTTVELEASNLSSVKIVAFGKSPEIFHSAASSVRSEDANISPSPDRQAAAIIRAARALDSKAGRPQTQQETKSSA